MNPKKISIKDYDYFLAKEKIAMYPLAQRDASRLLVYKENRIYEDIYKNIHQYLPHDSLLILNDTKVIEARLLFEKRTGGCIEILCLEPGPDLSDISTAMSKRGSVSWMCLIGGASKWKKGQVLQKNITAGSLDINLTAKYAGKINDKFLISLTWTPAHLSFSELLHHAGSIPLPPYIKRKPEISDLERYQTTYADPEGSVAAPTAGLHFTDEVFNKIRSKGTNIEFLTLHVGAGTFQPVKKEILEEHEMHPEFFDVRKSAIQSIIDNLQKQIIAVGTTTLRTIESLYWLGVKITINKYSPLDEIAVHQWEAYELKDRHVPVKDALEILLKYMAENQLNRFISKTQLLIAPGYQFKVTSGLITNFHQPQSTLLLLIAAFVGADWKMLYQYALNNEYRFLSYGDGCLLFRQQSGFQ